MNLAEKNYYWSAAIVQLLVHVGVRHFFIAPGSRNAPLSMACIRLAESDAQLQIHTFFDERSLAFAALGCAKACQEAVCVITTSGSAVANLLPATVEAYLTHVPLILLTADRPASLINCGANQAIQQPGIFSHYVEMTFELALPETQDPVDALALVAPRIHQSLANSGRPLHINVPLAEPLYPDQSLALPLYEFSRGQSVEPKAERVELQGKTLLIAGQLSKSAAAQVLAIAEQHQLLIWADAASQLRQLEHPLILPYPHFQLTGDQPFASFSNILQFGGRIVSKPLTQALSNLHLRYVVVSEYGDRLDPSGRAEQLWCPSRLWRTNVRVVDGALASDQHRFMLDSAHQRARRLLDCLPGHFGEVQLQHLLSQKVPADHLLFLGNSLSIRLYDQFAVSRFSAPQVVSNRGASGIDGLIATAAGLSLAGQNSVTAVIGDMSAIYDLNSFYWLRTLKQTFVLVVINNDGGGIFGMLPASEQQDVFQTAFQQPHGMTLSALAQAVGINAVQIDTTEATSAQRFDAHYRQACLHEGATLIEILAPAGQVSEDLRQIASTMVKGNA